jgi:hypothetical protein
MELKQKYSLAIKAKKLGIPELEPTLSAILKLVKDPESSIFVIDCWSAPFTKQISLITSELELALLLNNYDNVNIILASESTMKKLLKQEWVREYFAKQMPDFMVEEILSLIEGGEDQEVAWQYYVETWLPNNKMAEHLLVFQKEGD